MPRPAARELPLIGLVTSRLGDRPLKFCVAVHLASMASAATSLRKKAQFMANRALDAGRLVGYGVVTALLYALLFAFEDRILEVTGKGGWSFLIPLAIAFTLSYTHGTFTASFWDFFGIKAKR